MPIRRIAVVAVLLVISLAFQGNRANADASKKYERSIEKYSVPDVTLVDQNGRKVRLAEVLNAKDTVMVDFVFTTCTTICPLLSIGFSDFQKQLGRESGNVQLISIAIDPEHDSPKIMKTYLQKFEARPGWDFLTGSRDDIDKVLKAFSAYTTNKMSHPPLILLKSRSDAKWVRISGLIRTTDLLREYESVLQWARP